MNTRPVLHPAMWPARLAMLAGLVGVTLLAGCMTPATTVRYGQVVSEQTGQVSRTELYSGGTGVFSGGRTSADAERYDHYYGEPTVIYEDPGVTYGHPTVVQPPVVVAPPVYIDTRPQWYPWYPGYPYGTAYGTYYRGHRIAPPPRRDHSHRHRPHRPRAEGQYRGPRVGSGSPGPSPGVRQPVRPPAWSGGGHQRPGARPGPAPRPPAVGGGIRGGAGLPQAPPARGYGPRNSGENSGP